MLMDYYKGQDLDHLNFDDKAHIQLNSESKKLMKEWSKDGLPSRMIFDQKEWSFYCSAIFSIRFFEVVVIWSLFLVWFELGWLAVCLAFLVSITQDIILRALYKKRAFIPVRRDSFLFPLAVNVIVCCIGGAAILFTPDSGDGFVKGIVFYGIWFVVRAVLLLRGVIRMRKLAFCTK